MNIAPRKAMTVDDYLSRVAGQSETPRSELINGQIVSILPDRIAHNRVKGQVFIALRRAIADAAIRGEVFTNGLTVPIDDHTAYKPDALVRCGEPLSATEMKVPDPLILVESCRPPPRIWTRARS